MVCSCASGNSKAQQVDECTVIVWHYKLIDDVFKVEIIECKLNVNLHAEPAMPQIPSSPLARINNQLIRRDNRGKSSFF